MGTINTKLSSSFRLTLYAIFLGLLVVSSTSAQQPKLGPGESFSRSSAGAIDPSGARVGRKAEEPQLVTQSNHSNIRGQFQAYSNDVRIQFRNRLGLYTDDADGWTSKLYVRVHGTGKDVYSGVDTRLSGELNDELDFILYLDVKLHDRFDENDFRTELIRMLLFDQMLNVYEDNLAQVKTKTVSIPDWLVLGLEYSLRHKKLGRPSDFYSGFLKNGQLIDVENIVKYKEAKGLPPLQLEILRASAAILVDALCDQRDGHISMRALMGDLAKNPDADSLKLILKHFPAFRETDQGIDKWWALQLATMSQQQSFEYLSPEDTQKYLVAALKVKIAEYEAPEVKRKLFLGKAGKGKGKVGFLDRFKKRDAEATQESEKNMIPAFEGSIADYQKFLAHPSYDKIVSDRILALADLKIKGFPIYRDVIERYSLLCIDLSNVKKINAKGVAQRFQQVEQMRKRIDAVLPKCQDYMNYFEATQTPERSMAFENYFKFKERERSKGSLNDPLSNYMDEVEKVLSGPKRK